MNISLENAELLKNLPKEKIQEIQNSLKEKENFTDNMSLAFKIRINSFYGASALKMTPFSNGVLSGACIAISTRSIDRIAAIAADRTVQDYIYSLQNNKLDLNKLRNYDFSEKPENLKIYDNTLKNIVVADTDSTYTVLEEIVKLVKPNDNIMFCKKFSEEVLLKNVINLKNEFLESLNCVQPELIKYDNEVIAENFITTTLKRYFCEIQVKDGIIKDKPGLKTIGISLVSASTPEGVKEILKPVLDIFLKNNEKDLIKYLKDSLKTFESLKVQDISEITSVNNLDYKPFFNDTEVQDWKHANKFKAFNGERYLTAPLNSTGSLVYNNLIKDNNLLDKYQYIEANDKAYTVYLKVPNPITFNFKNISFIDPESLKDLGILDYIDYESQYNKNIKKKVQDIADVLGWKTENCTTELDLW